MFIYFMSGLTLARNCPRYQKVFLHVDQFNCPILNGLVVASQIFVDESRNNGPELVRVAEIGYCHKPCCDFLNRVSQSFGFRELVLQWWHGLPAYRQGFSPETFFQNVGDYGILEGKALVCSANADKCVWLSPFVEAFLRLHDKFCLSLEEAIEILYPICLLVEPYKYWKVLNQWIMEGYLPQGYLSIAFADECLIDYGGLASGPFP